MLPHLLLQVVAGELELKECNLNWSPEEFESKLQVSISMFIPTSSCVDNE